MLDGYPTNELLDVIYNRFFEYEEETKQLRADLAIAQTNYAAALDTLAALRAENARLRAEVEAACTLIYETVPYPNEWNGDEFEQLIFGKGMLAGAKAQARAARLTRADGDGQGETA